ILVFGVLTTLLVVTYAMLVSVMPRTGGAYAGLSHGVGGGLGIVLSITGWCVTLFLCSPVCASILTVPLVLTLAYPRGLNHRRPPSARFRSGRSSSSFPSWPLTSSGQTGERRSTARSGARRTSASLSGACSGASG